MQHPPLLGFFLLIELLFSISVCRWSMLKLLIYPKSSAVLTVIWNRSSIFSFVLADTKKWLREYFLRIFCTRGWMLGFGIKSTSWLYYVLHLPCFPQLISQTHMSCCFHTLGSIPLNSLLNLRWWHHKRSWQLANLELIRSSHDIQQVCNYYLYSKLTWQFVIGLVQLCPRTLVIRVPSFWFFCYWYAKLWSRKKCRRLI